MKVKIKPRHNLHDNDCWCDAISMLTNQEYDKVYKMFKPMLGQYGGLDGNIIRGYFSTKGFITLGVTDMMLYEAIDIYNTKNGIAFMIRNKESDNPHISYMKDNIIFDNLNDTYLEKFLYDYKVTDVIMKLEDNYE